MSADAPAVRLEPHELLHAGDDVLLDADVGQEEVGAAAGSIDMVIWAPQAQVPRSTQR